MPLDTFKKLGRKENEWRRPALKLTNALLNNLGEECAYNTWENALIVISSSKKCILAVLDYLVDS